MASVEQLKTFEETVAIEVMLRDKYNKLLDDVQKAEVKLVKMREKLDEARIDWNKYEEKKSQQFDQLLTAQNL